VADGSGGETVFPSIKVKNDTRDPKIWSECALEGLAVKAVSTASRLPALLLLFPSALVIGEPSICSRRYANQRVSRSPFEERKAV
jgi:hypothetical protein